MSKFSEYLALAWAHPAIMLVIILLLVAVIWFLAKFAYTHVSRSRLQDNSLSGKQVDKDRNHDSRRVLRKKVAGMRADISDGLASYSGLVINISQMGLCLKDVPDKLSTSRSLLSVVIRDKSENYRIVARPRWTHPQDNRGVTIGAEIASSPENWTDFILSH